jgi:hypothetical protein
MERNKGEELLLCLGFSSVFFLSCLSSVCLLACLLAFKSPHRAFRFGCNVGTAGPFLLDAHHPTFISHPHTPPSLVFPQPPPHHPTPPFLSAYHPILYTNKQTNKHTHTPNDPCPHHQMRMKGNSVSTYSWHWLSFVFTSRGLSLKRGSTAAVARYKGLRLASATNSTR